MGCMFGYPVDCCDSCEAFDYCTEYSNEMSYEEYLKSVDNNNISKGDD